MPQVENVQRRTSEQEALQRSKRDVLDPNYHLYFLSDLTRSQSRNIHSVQNHRQNSRVVLFSPLIALPDVRGDCNILDVL